MDVSWASVNGPWILTRAGRRRIGLRRDETRWLLGLASAGERAEVAAAVAPVGARAMSAVECSRREVVLSAGGAKDAMYARESRLEGDERRMERIKSCGHELRGAGATYIILVV